jgi:hypothetical protein
MLTRSFIHPTSAAELTLAACCRRRRRCCQVDMRKRFKGKQTVTGEMNK